MIGRIFLDLIRLTALSSWWRNEAKDIRNNRNKDTQYNSVASPLRASGVICPADPISAVPNIQRPQYFWAISFGISIVMEIGQCFITQGSNNTGVGEVDFMQIFRFLLTGATYV